jgi:hypothetical protein
VVAPRRPGEGEMVEARLAYGPDGLSVTVVPKAWSVADARKMYLLANLINKHVSDERLRSLVEWCKLRRNL